MDTPDIDKRKDITAADVNAMIHQRYVAQYPEIVGWVIDHTVWDDAARTLNAVVPVIVLLHNGPWTPSDVPDELVRCALEILAEYVFGRLDTSDVPTDG